MALQTGAQYGALDGGGEGDGEEGFGVLPGAGGAEAGGGEEVVDPEVGEFVAVFGVNGFAGWEVEGDGWAGGVCGDVDLLWDEGFEVHLYAGVLGVPAGAVGEAGGVEVRAEIAVETGKDVAVEGGGDAGGIVVGGEEGGDGLVGAGGEVRAEEEGVAGAELGAEVAEEIGGLPRGEVADGGADVEGEGEGVAVARVGAGEGEGRGGVVGDLRADGDAGDVRFDAGGGFFEGARGDVDGLVEDASLPADGGREEDAGLAGGAGAELEQGEGVSGGGGGGEDGVGVGGEDGALGAGEVVLGEGGDLLEEGGAAVVVKEPGGEGAGVLEEAGVGLAGDGIGDGWMSGGFGGDLWWLGCWGEVQWAS